MTRRPSIRHLLLITNASVLLFPIFAGVFLHLWDGHLVRVTEQQLIAESVLIGEAFRDRVREEHGATDDRDPRNAPLSPIAPVLPLNYSVQPPVPPPSRFAAERDGTAWRAGTRVLPLMERAQRTNLSAARVLDASGCIVASTGDDRGACLDHLPEVRSALAGHYAAVARERLHNEPSPPYDSPSRRGAVRVFTITPIRDDGQVIGAVYMSRTSSSPLEAVWDLRYTVLAALALCLTLTLVVSTALSRWIIRPVEATTVAMDAVARGESAPALRLGGFVPAEVATLNAALARMTAQLTDRATYIEQFAATASHELKTPLTGIRGAVELLREDWEKIPDTQRRRFLDNISADATRMQHLVTRLLQLARIQSAPEAAEAIVLEPFCTALVARYDGQVRLHASDAPPSLTMVPEHLETALRNLLDNAVRYGKGQPADLTVARHGAQVAFTVRNHGPAISPGNRERIFDRFFTTERDAGGTGLGLAIVKAVAETRGGSVGFETGSEGTTFTLIV